MFVLLRRLVKEQVIKWDPHSLNMSDFLSTPDPNVFMCVPCFHHSSVAWSSNWNIIKHYRFWLNHRWRDTYNNIICDTYCIPGTWRWMHFWMSVVRVLIPRLSFPDLSQGMFLIKEICKKCTCRVICSVKAKPRTVCILLCWCLMSVYYVRTYGWMDGRIDRCILSCMQSRV